MNKILLCLLCIFLVLALMACAEPRVLLDSVHVQNATNSSITNVKVRHEPTNKFGSVSAILPQQSLNIGLPRLPLLANKAIVSWRDGHDREWSAIVSVPYDRSAAKQGQPMNLVYIIYASGQVVADIRPVEKLQ